MKFYADKKAIPAKAIKSGVVGGHTYTLTSQYFLRDGKPCIYRMGELHFSRVPQKDWERELKKMKQGGIDIVASYLFWNHLETDEGKFDFTGNRDLRAFIDCCEALEMPENTSYIIIHARGNLGAVYEENNGFRLINDHYIDGDEWIADVRDINRVIIKIQPLTDTDKDRIYFENSFVTGDFVPEVYAQGDNIFITTPKGKTT